MFCLITSNWSPGVVPDIRPLNEPLVDTTIQVYSTITSQLLPTPAKSHYTFNLRDLSKVFQGILMAEAGMIEVVTSKGINLSWHKPYIWNCAAFVIFRTNCSCCSCGTMKAAGFSRIAWCVLRTETGSTHSWRTALRGLVVALKRLCPANHFYMAISWLQMPPRKSTRSYVTRKRWVWSTRDMKSLLLCC